MDARSVLGPSGHRPSGPPEARFIHQCVVNVLVYRPIVAPGLDGCRGPPIPIRLSRAMSESTPAVKPLGFDNQSLARRLAARCRPPRRLAVTFVGDSHMVLCCTCTLPPCELWSFATATRSATRASPPSWRRRRRQVRCRRRRECWRSSGSSTSTTPRSPTPAAPLWPLRSTAARCLRSRRSILEVALPVPRRRPQSLRHWQSREPASPLSSRSRVSNEKTRVSPAPGVGRRRSGGLGT